MACSTPMHCACHSEVTHYWPLHSAVINSQLIPSDIREFGCNPQTGNNYRSTPLHCACQKLNGHVEVTEYLIIMNTNTVQNMAILHLCIHLLPIATWLHVVKYLSCNPQISNDYGSTPLHHAHQNGCLEVAVWLITEHPSKNCQTSATIQSEMVS